MKCEEEERNKKKEREEEENPQSSRREAIFPTKKRLHITEELQQEMKEEEGDM